ncbi:MAG: hypothetical protein IPH20_04345 [Bacteroidales bacterium]|nr:hypothetical protein [Bacteroidales bacterium]
MAKRIILFNLICHPGLPDALQAGRFNLSHNRHHWRRWSSEAGKPAGEPRIRSETRSSRLY